jgi:hypothetical protein
MIEKFQRDVRRACIKANGGMAHPWKEQEVTVTQHPGRRLPIDRERDRIVLTGQYQRRNGAVKGLILAGVRGFGVPLAADAERDGPADPRAPRSSAHCQRPASTEQKPGWR